MSATMPQKGELWRHFKGGLYEIIAVPCSTQDARKHFVVYRAGDGTEWARPLEEWQSTVRRDGTPGVPRFVREAVTPSADTPG